MFVGRLVSYGARISPRQEPKLAGTDRGLLHLIAHRPIDGAGADGSAEGAGGAEPGPSNDHGGNRACIDQVVVPTAPPRSSARDKDAVRHRVVNERRVLKHPKAQHWVWKHFMVYTKEALVNIDVCIIYVSGTYARWFPISVLFPCVLGSSDCFLRYSATPELLEPVLQ